MQTRLKATLDTVPEPIYDTIARFKRETAVLMEGLRDGKINLQQWLNGMRQLIVKYHMASMMVGAGQLVLSDAMRATVGLDIEYQLGWLDDFASALRVRENYYPVWRAEMYALAPVISFQEGEIIREYGRMLPLPAMPKQGTTCLSNCGCKWKIVVIDLANGDFNCKWERHKDDSCQVCKQREDDWGNVKIRRWQLMRIRNGS